MKKLKIILKYNKIILFIIIILSILITNFYKPKSKFNNEHEIYGYIRSKKNNALEIKSKEHIIVYTNNTNFNLNDYVYIKGNMYLPKENTVFNTFNYKKYLSNKKIYYLMKVDKIKLIKKNNNIFYKIKNNIINKIDKYKSSNYLKIFILGDKTSLDMKEIYSNLGIIHLFSISGMHISILCFILNKLLCKTKYKNIVIYMIFLFFIFLTSYQISIIRSCLSYIFSDINKKNKLNISSENRLILIVILLLIINPFFINNIGFKFSCIITFFIIHYSYLLENKNYALRSFIISFISFLSSLPILINTYYNVNLLSVLLNIIYVPFVSIIMFPISIITFIFPVFDKYFKMIIDIFENITLFFDSIKLFNISFSKIPIVLILLYYFLLFNKNKKIIFLIIIFYFYNIYSFNLKLYFIDVGQGDSALIRYKNKNILIDTGGKINDHYIIKNNITFFKSIGVKKIDYIFLSHGDLDHCGEAINLVNNFKVEKVIFNCGPYNDLEKKLIKVLDKKNIKYYSCIKELNIDKNKFYFLQTKEYDNENDNSNVIYTELNGYKFMFMGDASTATEREILSKYNLPNIDILKVGHHGSKTSSSKEFINEISPKYSIISVGKKNRYGHPNKEVLDNLGQSKIYRTDQDGSIMFKIKNNKLEIEICSP